NLSSLYVFDATNVPEPASALLLVTGLLGCLMRRGRRQPAGGSPT
ncbi:MAG: PEP-CTERM sorting domain-containing protein, partial [Oxalobacteraceae bacterium]